MNQYKDYTIEILRGRKNHTGYFTSYAIATHISNGNIISGDIRDTPKLAVINVKAKIDKESTNE